MKHYGWSSIGNLEVSNSDKAKFVKKWVKLNPVRMQPKKGTMEELWGSCVAIENDHYFSSIFGSLFLYTDEIQALLKEMRNRGVCA